MGTETHTAVIITKPRWILDVEWAAINRFVHRFGHITFRRRHIWGCLKDIEWWTLSNGRFRLEGPSLIDLLSEMEQLIERE